MNTFSAADRAFITQFESSLLFDDDILEALSQGRKLGVAVSGGADSLALLTACLHRFGKDALSVITVNHNMRAEAETAGDAAFVADYCDAQGIFCAVEEIPRGKVSAVAAARARGEEEAARFLRYEAFERFIAQHKLCALCLAHNQNDMLETLVMRFLQGSATASGIARRRGAYIRPLLETARADIERYLRVQKLTWRTDATNADTRYMRNRIRHVLLPALDTVLPGWKRAVLLGAQKAAEDEEALAVLSEALVWEAVTEVSEATLAKEAMATEAALGAPAVSFFVSCDDFYAASLAVRRRALYTALTKIGETERFPYRLVQAVCDKRFLQHGALTACGVTVFVKNGRLFVKKMQKKATESGFLAILTEEERECAVHGVQYAVNADGVLLKTAQDGAVSAVLRVHLPLCIRSAQSADVVRAKDGAERSVSGLFSAWKIPRAERVHIPVVQELLTTEQPLVAVLGSAVGSSDWIEQERKWEVR